MFIIRKLYVKELTEEIGGTCKKEILKALGFGNLGTHCLPYEEGEEELKECAENRGSLSFAPHLEIPEVSSFSKYPTQLG